MPPDGHDRELVARINRGDAAAFEQLYERYREWVFNLAVRWLGDAHEAQDVMQETFLKLYDRFPGFELTAAVTTFLYPTVEGMCHRRRARGRRTVQFDEEAIPLAHEGGQSTEADAAILLARLAPEQRQILHLRFTEDLTIPQMAARLNEPAGTIKSRLHYALLAVRRRAERPLRRGMR